MKLNNEFNVYEGSNAEVGQLITGYKFGCFLTPCLASKSFQTLYLQSLAQLRLVALHIIIFVETARKFLELFKIFSIDSTNYFCKLNYISLLTSYYTLSRVAIYLQEKQHAFITYRCCTCYMKLCFNLASR